MIKLYNENGNFKKKPKSFHIKKPTYRFEKSTDFILTKQDIDVIMSMLDDIDDFCGLKPEERELREKIEKLTIE